MLVENSDKKIYAIPLLSLYYNQPQCYSQSSSQLKRQHRK